MRFKIGIEDAGILLRDFLEKQNLSKKAIKLIKMQGEILVNGKHQTVRYIIKIDDIIELIWPEEITMMEPFAMQLKIYYEDDNYLVIDKPAGIPSIPTKRYPKDTLANAIVNYFQTKQLKATVHLVNRLDKDTQGLLLVAKNSYAHYLLSKDIKQVTRVYHCNVEGKLVGSATINLPIKKADDSVKRIIHPNGKVAITHYRSLEANEQQSKIECVLETGRTHQIRVHLASINHPLVGDSLYGSTKETTYYLDSVELRFINPFTNKKIKINKLK